MNKPSCVNKECSQNGTCTRFNYDVVLRRPVIYPDGGQDCPLYEIKTESGEIIGKD